MAQSGRADADKHFARPGRIDLDLLDAKGLALLVGSGGSHDVKDGGAGFHGILLDGFTG
jgi:hypothetical protein